MCRSLQDLPASPRCCLDADQGRFSQLGWDCPRATVDYEKLMPGLKLTLDSTFQPNTGDKSGKFKTEYKHEKLIFNADLGVTKR